MQTYTSECLRNSNVGQFLNKTGYMLWHRCGSPLALQMSQGRGQRSLLGLKMANITRSSINIGNVKTLSSLTFFHLLRGLQRYLTIPITISDYRYYMCDGKINRGVSIWDLFFIHGYRPYTLSFLPGHFGKMFISLKDTLKSHFSVCWQDKTKHPGN